MLLKGMRLSSNGPWLVPRFCCWPGSDLCSERSGRELPCQRVGNRKLSTVPDLDSQFTHGLRISLFILHNLMSYYSILQVKKTEVQGGLLTTPVWEQESCLSRLQPSWFPVLCQETLSYGGKERLGGSISWAVPVRSIDGQCHLTGFWAGKPGVAETTHLLFVTWFCFHEFFRWPSVAVEMKTESKSSAELTHLLGAEPRSSHN